MKEPCRICGEESWSKGLCGKHYQIEWRKTKTHVKRERKHVYRPMLYTYILRRSIGENMLMSKVIEDISNKVGVSPAHLRNISYGRSDPSLSVAIKIAQIFDLSIEELFSEREGGK